MVRFTSSCLDQSLSLWASLRVILTCLLFIVSASVQTQAIISILSYLGYGTLHQSLLSVPSALTYMYGASKRIRQDNPQPSAWNMVRCVTIVATAPEDWEPKTTRICFVTVPEARSPRSR